MSATYDYASHEWTARCPHGDVCSGCDAFGYCTRMEANAFDALTTESALQRTTPEVCPCGTPGECIPGTPGCCAVLRPPTPEGGAGE